MCRRRSVELSVAARMKDHCSAWAEGGGGLCDEHAGFQCEYCKKILGSLTHWREHMMATHLVDTGI